jgi:molybdopterin/thiamine biosynthesis adenylyltransferase
LYTLDNSFALRNRFEVVVAGCGGTGGFVAEGLCRVLPSNALLVLVDHDRVEERNLIRQNFTRRELGQIKSEVLANRLSRKYERPVAYSTLPIGLTPLKDAGIVVDCVDNGLARRHIARKFMIGNYSWPAWWVDSGNGENYGQVLIGNYPDKAGYAVEADRNKWQWLPLPTVQRPDLLAQQPPARDCADISGQGPTINQCMAVLVIEVVRRIIEGTCSWLQLYLDMNTGTLQPVFATTEAIEDIMGKKFRKEVNK